MDTTAILQRTDIGLETIKTKSIKLTQSERLILIVVDGVTSYGTLRDKVWALSTERFTRALKTLLDKELIYEVLLPDAYQQPEELDSTVVDRFLQQDPLDPVTIISMDPEDHFGSDLIAEMGHVLPSPPSAAPPKAQALPTVPELSGANHAALLPARSDDAEDESRDAPDLQAKSDPVNSADIVLSVQKNKPRPEVQIDPATAPAPDVKHAAQRPSHGDHVEVEPLRVSGSTEYSIRSSKPESGKTRNDRPDSRPEKFGSSAPHSKSNEFRRTPAASASKKWSEDLLKLCSWTGVVGGLVILMVAILKYYGTAV